MKGKIGVVAFSHYSCGGRKFSWRIMGLCLSAQSEFYCTLIILNKGFQKLQINYFFLKRVLSSYICLQALFVLEGLTENQERQDHSMQDCTFRRVRQFGRERNQLMKNEAGFALIISVVGIHLPCRNEPSGGMYALCNMCV